MLTDVTHWIETLPSEVFESLPEEKQKAMNNVFSGIETLIKDIEII